MAQFRGTVEGNRGEASRLGHKTSGLVTECNAWDIGIKCQAHHRNGEDVIEIMVNGGSRTGRDRGGSVILGWVDSSGKICVNHDIDNVHTLEQRMRSAKASKADKGSA